MSSKEYIKRELKNIITIHRSIKLFYEYDKLSKIHSVKILPDNFTEINDNFVEFQYSLIEYFIENYPSESILFVSNESPIEINNPEFTLIGDLYLDLNKRLSQLEFNKLLKSLSSNCNFNKKPEKIAGENNYALAA